MARLMKMHDWVRGEYGGSMVVFLVYSSSFDDDAMGVEESVAEEGVISLLLSVERREVLGRLPLESDEDIVLWMLLLDSEFKENAVTDGNVGRAEQAIAAEVQRADDRRSLDGIIMDKVETAEDDTAMLSIMQCIVL
jgi:hypothetical protein